MRLEELRKGFRGYRRDDVFAYFTELENAYNTRLAELEEKNAAALSEAEERAARAESEKDALAAELAGLRARQDQISMALIDARATAEEMKTQTLAREREARETIQRELDDTLDELERYRAKTMELRGHIRAALEGMDGELDGLLEKVEALSGDAPAGNLALFS